MPNLVLDLIVDRVDMVDEGANSAAFIKLYKRKETEPIMDLEEILAKMAAEHVTVIREALAKAKEVAEETLANAKKEVPAATTEELNTLTEELAKARKAIIEAPVAKSKEEQFQETLKGLDPAVQEVFKSLNAQKLAAEEAVRTVNEANIQATALAKAKEFKSIPVDEAKIVEVLKSASPEVIEILTAVNKAIDEGALFQEAGSTQSGATNNAWSKIEKMADAMAKKDSITVQKAITMVVRENPDLYKQYIEGGAN